MTQNNLLTLDDYQNLLSFSQEVHVLGECYFDGVLMILKKYFGWHLSLHYVLEQVESAEKQAIQSIGSLSFNRRILNRFKEVYLSDVVLFQKVQKRCLSNEWNGLFYTQNMISAEAYRSTGYYEILSQYDIEYGVIMSVNTSPELRIHIFKTSEEGPFSTREMELLFKIREILLVSVAMQMVSGDRKNAWASAAELLDMQHIGVLILDSTLSFHDCNKQFLQLSTYICKSMMVHEVVREFLAIIQSNEKKHIHELSDGTSFVYQEYCISIYKRPSLGKSVNRWQYYVCTLRPASDCDKAETDNPTEAYGLTNRERQILELILEGSSNKDIANRLCISMHTVKTHISNLLPKLNVDNRTAAISLFRNHI